jgi:hypothetical protein
LGTLAQGINSSGEIVGYYTDAGFRAHGFVDNGRNYATFDDPFAVAGEAVILADGATSSIKSREGVKLRSKIVSALSCCRGWRTSHVRL